MPEPAPTVEHVLGEAVALVLAREGRWAVAATEGAVVLFDLAGSGAVAARAPVRDVGGLDATGDAVLALDTGGRVHRLELPSLEARQLPAPAYGEGAGPLLGPQGDAFAVASWSGDLAVHDAVTGAVRRHEHAGDMVSHVVASPDRSRLAYALAGDRRVRILVRAWPFDGAATVAWEGGRRTDVDALALAGDGRLAVREPGRLTLLDGAGKVIAQRGLEESGSPQAVVFLDGGALAATDGDRVVGLDGDLRERWALDVPYPCALDWCPAAGLLAIGSWHRGLVVRPPAG